MKYLYFGTICAKEHYMQMYQGFRVKPSVAPFTFETALLKGFKENNADIEVISFPVIPAFPKSKYLCWGNRRETLDSGYQTTWISAVNITGLKQFFQSASSRRLLKKWLKSNADEEKAVIIYSAYQPVAKSIVRLCKKYNTKCYVIIPDLPRDMFNVAKVSKIKKLLSQLYVRAAERVQGGFDGYIYLTEAMKDVINPNAPYTVVEGIANATEARALTQADKVPGNVVMYAGALNKKLGLENLILGFQKADIPNSQLWLFGSGDFEHKIKEYAAADDRIRFFGRVSRDEILQYEKQATLLVNVRDDRDEFTKYSFPSKVIEYMLSGTPLFMTRLPGIPEEYYSYTFNVTDNEVDTLCESFKQILSKDRAEMLAFGAQAQRFIAENKNGHVQAKKIIDFIGNVAP